MADLPFSFASVRIYKIQKQDILPPIIAAFTSHAELLAAYIYTYTIIKSAPIIPL